jgi:parvulin-like peptidyl-prolyl isomerase
MSRPLLLVLSGLLAAASFAAAAPQSATGTPADDVLAVVNGEPVRLADVELLLAEMHSGVGETSRGEFDIDRLLFRLVNDVLLAQEARTLEMHEEPAVRHAAERVRERAMVETLLEAEVRGRAAASDEQVEQAFREQFTRVTLRVLTVGERETAEELLARIDGGEEMAELARQLSLDPYAAQGGLAESLARQDLAKAIADAAFALAPGQLGGPVLTDLGWTIVLVESFEQPDPARFAAVAPRLRALASAENARELRSALADAARERHAVSIDEKVVDQIEPDRIEAGRLVPQVSEPEAVVARIGEGTTITAAELGQKLLARWTGVRSEDAARAARSIILGGMIEDALLLAEARARGYADHRAVVGQVETEVRQLLVKRYLEEVVAADLGITNAAMKAYYEQNQDRFRRPPRVHLGQITVPTEEEAERMAGLLRAGADLAWLAREHSTDRFAAHGGDRGWIVPRGTDPANEQLRTAPVGTVLDPAGVPGNWIVMIVTAREEQGIYPFDEVSGNVRQALFNERFRDRLDQWVTKLRERSEIEVREDVVASLQLSGDQEGGTGGGGGGHHH